MWFGTMWGRGSAARNGTREGWPKWRPSRRSLASWRGKEAGYQPGYQAAPRGPSDYANAALQYSTHFLTSLTTSEPSGVSYSYSMLAGNLYFCFFMSCKISLSGVSPCPHGMLGPPPPGPLFSPTLLGPLRSFRCKLAMRSWYFSTKGTGDWPLTP